VAPEVLLLLGLSAGGALGWALSRLGLLSGWAALALPAALPLAGAGLTVLFC
jgi:hypothetical protein